MSLRSSTPPLLPGFSNKGVHGGYEDEDETREPLPFPGHAQRPNDQDGPFTLHPAQSASLAPGTQPSWFGRDPLRAGAKRPAAAYFPCADPEFLESIGEPVAAGSQAESTVRSTWQAQAAPVLAGRAATIPVERAAHPSTATDHAPPSAAGASRAGSNAAASKVEKKSVPGPRGTGGVASTHDAPGGADGSRSRATTPAVAFQRVRMGTVIKDGYHLLYNHHFAATEVGSETCKALKREATHTTAEVVQLLRSASTGLPEEWRGALVIPAIEHDATESRAGSVLHRLADAVARGADGDLRTDLLRHAPRESARATPRAERATLLASAFTCAELPTHCSKAIIVDDAFDTCATGEAIASALKHEAARAGQELTIALVCVARCVRHTERAANAHLPVAVRERLDAALDKDDAEVAPVLTREQRGIVYRSLNYVGSSARLAYVATWSGEDMVAVRAKEHNHLLDKGIHGSPKHQEQAVAYRALHSAWPPFEVLEVLCSKEDETEDAFRRRVIRAEQRQLDALGDARSNASATAGRPSSENCAKGGRISGPYGGQNDARLADATIALQAADQAHESALEALRRAPQDPAAQAAAAETEQALDEAQDAYGMADALWEQSHDAKVTGGRISGPYGSDNDARLVDATIALEAAEQAHKSAQEALLCAPQDQAAQAAAAGTGQALADAQDEYGTADAQKAFVQEAKERGRQNVPKGQGTQKCSGCGRLGGAWSACPRNEDEARRQARTRKVHPPHPDGGAIGGSPNGRSRAPNKGVFAHKLHLGMLPPPPPQPPTPLGPSSKTAATTVAPATAVAAQATAVASAATAAPAQPEPRGLKRPPPHPHPLQPQTHKIANFPGSRLRLAMPPP